MDVVFLQEAAIPSAAVHDFVAEATLEEALCLLDNAGKPWYTAKRFGLWRE